MLAPIPNSDRVNQFIELLAALPHSIVEKLNRLKLLRERPDFHPEPSAFEHVKIVTCRLLSTEDKDLIMAGIFHDITKLDDAKINQKNGYPTSPGHDKGGAIFATKHSQWIEEYGANPENVAWICENHMRIQQIDEMKKPKQDLLRNHPMYEKLLLFTKADKMTNHWDEEDQRSFELSPIHAEILDAIESYLSKPGASDLRFTQALFNLGINEFASPENPEEKGFLFRDNHNDSDLKILKNLKDAKN